MLRLRLPATVVLLIAGCGRSDESTGPAPTTPATRAEELVGNWELAAIDDAAPASKNIKSYRLRIDPGGGWYAEYETAGGVLAGRVLRVDGAWNVADGVIDYTA